MPENETTKETESTGLLSFLSSYPPMVVEDNSPSLKTDYSSWNFDNVFLNKKKQTLPPEQPKEAFPLTKGIYNFGIPKTNKTDKTTFTTHKEFVSTMRDTFRKKLEEKGLNPNYADSLVAQAALESAWGKSTSGKNNYGGIKGKGTTRRTREVINGKSTYINDSFRDFNSLDEYADYQVNLLNGPRYKAFSGDFISRVVKGGYATDPNYKNIFNSVLKRVKSVQSDS